MLLNSSFEQTILIEPNRSFLQSFGSEEGPRKREKENIAQFLARKREMFLLQVEFSIF